jgi:hypothetical protein
LRASQSAGTWSGRLSTVIHIAVSRGGNLCLAVPGADLAEPCVFSGHELCQPVTGSGTDGDNFWVIVDNFSRLGISCGKVPLRRGKPAYVLCMREHLCVDWHRCDSAGRGWSGDMWIAYPQVFRGRFLVTMRKLALIPTVHTTTVKTGFLHILLIDTCGRTTLWWRKTLSLTLPYSGITPRV